MPLRSRGARGFPADARGAFLADRSREAAPPPESLYMECAPEGAGRGMRVRSRPRPLLLLSLAALAMALALLGCHRGKPAGEAEQGGRPLEGGRISTKVEETATRNVTTLWALERRRKVVAGYGVADITLTPVEPGKGGLEIQEREVGACSPEWRSSARMALCNAALLVGRPLDDQKVGLSVFGPLDGPSAGASVAVALLSALTGTPLELPALPGPAPMTESGAQLSNRPEPVMSAVAQPDATLGAVWALPQKLDAAQQALRTRVLIPAGQRRDYDSSATPPAWVDVVDRGRALKVEVKEAGTLAQAYEGFTGQPLPWPAAASAPKLEGTSNEWLVGAAKRRLSAAGDDLARAGKAAPEVLDRTTQLGAFDAAAAEVTYQMAYSFLADADYGAALEIATEVQRHCGIGLRMNRVLEAWAKKDRDLAALPDLARAQAPDPKKLDSFRQRIDEVAAEVQVNPDEPSLGDLVSLADTYAVGLSGAALLKREQDGFLQDVRDAEKPTEALEATRRLLALYATADATLTMADSRIGVGLGTGGPEAPKSQDLLPWTALMEAAARANLEYIERGIVAARAGDVGLPPEEFRRWLLAQDADFARCVGCIAALDQLESFVGKEGRRPEIARYGLAVEGLTLSSLLVARYYSVDTRFDRATLQASPTNRTALQPMLEQSRARANALLVEARAAKAATVVPSCSLAAAEALLRRMPADPARKLEALGLYWRASLYARTSTLFAVPVEVKEPKAGAKAKSKSGGKAKTGAAPKKAPAAKAG
jgi:hypothetical protein